MTTYKRRVYDHAKIMYDSVNSYKTQYIVHNHLVYTKISVHRLQNLTSKNSYLREILITEIVFRFSAE